jgi:hypothetical protein
MKLARSFFCVALIEVAWGAKARVRSSEQLDALDSETCAPDATRRALTRALSELTLISNVKMTGPPTFAAKPPPAVVGPCRLISYVSWRHLHEQLKAIKTKPGECAESTT